jgi:hypothetical protein
MEIASTSAMESMPSFCRGWIASEKSVATFFGFLSFFCLLSLQRTFPTSYSVRVLTEHSSALKGMPEISRG